MGPISRRRRETLGQGEIRLVLYTPLALEQVLASPLTDEGAATLMRVDERTCLVRVGPDGRRRVERLLSTDPRDFLDPRWQPGQLVD